MQAIEQLQRKRMQKCNMPLRKVFSCDASSTCPFSHTFKKYLNIFMSMTKVVVVFAPIMNGYMRSSHISHLRSWYFLPECFVFCCHHKFSVILELDHALLFLFFPKGSLASLQRETRRFIPLSFLKYPRVEMSSFYPLRPTSWEQKPMPWQACTAVLGLLFYLLFWSSVSPTFIYIFWPSLDFFPNTFIKKKVFYF